MKKKVVTHDYDRKWWAIGLIYFGWSYNQFPIRI